MVGRFIAHISHFDINRPSLAPKFAKNPFSRKVSLYFQSFFFEKSSIKGSKVQRMGARYFYFIFILTPFQRGFC